MSNLLKTILFTQLIAVVLAIIGKQTVFAASIGLISLYCHWVVLSTYMSLMILRPYLAKMKVLLGSILIFIVGFSNFTAVEIVSQLVLADIYGDFSLNQFFERSIIFTIILSLVIRAMSLQGEFESHIRSEAEQRFSALQSKIRPHFLFNCLNTISELINERPRDAEHAINSLAMLFRATLENERNWFSLEQEITLCRRFVELETWRFGERLRVQWTGSVENADQWFVPKLILQPLIENAIIYGVQPNGKIDVTVDVRETQSHISVRIVNQKGEAPLMKAGNGIAIANIKERLFVMYDHDHAFRVDDRGDRYSVTMRLPKQVDRQLHGIN